jgi:hypothetical protein
MQWLDQEGVQIIGSLTQYVETVACNAAGSVFLKALDSSVDGRANRHHGASGTLRSDTRPIRRRAMKLRQLLEHALGIPQDVPIHVCGLYISPRCGFCGQHFGPSELVMVSMSEGCGYHLQCQAEITRCKYEGPN